MPLEPDIAHAAAGSSPPAPEPHGTRAVVVTGVIVLVLGWQIADVATGL